MIFMQAGAVGFLLTEMVNAEPEMPRAIKVSERPETALLAVLREQKYARLLDRCNVV